MDLVYNMENLQKQYIITGNVVVLNNLSSNSDVYMSNDTNDINNDNNKQNEDDSHYEIEKIIAHKGKGKAIKYLVKWKNYNNKHNTWIALKDLKAGEFIEDYWNNME
jgi:hypothetical protein